MRKFQFSTLTYLNPGFGGSWDMLAIFFVNVSKEVFWTKEFLNKVQKAHEGPEGPGRSGRSKRSGSLRA